MRRKKGSLALSINAIVILILAITMLGLGLTFIRGLFSSAEGKIKEISDAAELANPPTRDNPLTIFPNKLEFRKTKTAKVDIAYLNVNEEDTQCKITSFEPSVDTNDIVIEQYPQSVIKMQKDGIALWKMILDESTLVTDAERTELYSITMDCWDKGVDVTNPANPPIRSTRKDIFITVQP